MATFSVRNSAVWDFWNDRLVSAEEGERELSVEVAPGDTVLYRVTPLVRDAPTLMSVSRHVTQGGYELKSYSADANGAKGVVRCPGGETVLLTFYLPEGTRLGSASHASDLEDRVFRLKVVSEVPADIPFVFSLKGESR